MSESLNKTISSFLIFILKLYLVINFDLFLWLYVSVNKVVYRCDMCLGIDPHAHAYTHTHTYTHTNTYTDIAFFFFNIVCFDLYTS